MQCTVSTDDVKRISIRRKTHRIARFTDDTVENGLVGAVAPRARQVLVPTREGEQDDQSRNQEDKLHSEGSLRRTCVGELMSASCGRQRGADDLKNPQPLSSSDDCPTDRGLARRVDCYKSVQTVLTSSDADQCQQEGEGKA